MGYYCSYLLIIIFKSWSPFGFFYTLISLGSCGFSGLLSVSITSDPTKDFFISDVLYLFVT